MKSKGLRRPTVLLTPPLTWRLVWDGGHTDDAGVWGMTKDKQGEILLDNTAQPDRQRMTLLHEWFHTERHQFPKEDQLTERQICLMSAALLRMMKANPGVVSWLMEDAP